MNKLLSHTEKKFNRGSSRKWKNKDFEDLCFTIHLETKILVSSGTLKRVFGKIETNKDYFPQEATITALEIYSGYELFPAAPKKKGGSKSNILSYITGGLFLLVVVVFVFINQKDHEIPTGELRLAKIDGTSPATVYFNYQHSPTTDSVFVRWGDNSDPQCLKQQEGTTSHYYRYPGKFTANLETRDSVISNQVLFFVPTDGWQVLASYYEQEYEERFFPVPLEENFKNGAFSLSRRYMSSLGMDTTRIIILQLENYKKTDTSGDSFSLETNITNSAFWPAIRCFSAFIMVEGDEGRVYFKFVNRGCSQFSEYVIGEKNQDNHQKDLSGFSIEMLEWNHIEIENIDKQVTVSANNVVVFEDSYTSSIGNIIGVTIMFHGIGSIDYYHLKDASGQLIFSEEFE